MSLLKSEVCPIEDWSEQAINQCMQLLANETKTSFEIKAEYEKCYFGDIFIETTSSRTHNIADKLKQDDEAIDIDFEPSKRKLNQTVYNFKRRTLNQCLFMF